MQVGHNMEKAMSDAVDIWIYLKMKLLKSLASYLLRDPMQTGDTKFRSYVGEELPPGQSRGTYHTLGAPNVIMFHVQQVISRP